jgi:hypothetical protein
VIDNPTQAPRVDCAEPAVANAPVLVGVKQAA